jgi:hypothetical protein
MSVPARKIIPEKGSENAEIGMAAEDFPELKQADLRFCPSRSHKHY